LEAPGLSQLLWAPGRVALLVSEKGRQPPPKTYPAAGGGSRFRQNWAGQPSKSTRLIWEMRRPCLAPPLQPREQG